MRTVVVDGFAGTVTVRAGIEFGSVGELACVSRVAIAALESGPGFVARWFHTRNPAPARISGTAIASVSTTALRERPVEFELGVDGEVLGGNAVRQSRPSQYRAPGAPVGFGYHPGVSGAGGWVRTWAPAMSGADSPRETGASRVAASDEPRSGETESCSARACAKTPHVGNLLPGLFARAIPKAGSNSANSGLISASRGTAALRCRLITTAALESANIGLPVRSW